MTLHRLLGTLSLTAAAALVPGGSTPPSDHHERPDDPVLATNPGDN